jgi:hypothetical protein
VAENRAESKKGEERGKERKKKKCEDIFPPLSPHTSEKEKSSAKGTY